VSDCHFEGAAIVTVIVVVNGEIQTAIGRCTYCHLAADEKRLTHLARCRANVTNQGARPGTRKRSGPDNRTKTSCTSTFRSNLTQALARYDSSSRCDRYLVASAHIDRGVRPT
jgi:hypothetical protein